MSRTSVCAGLAVGALAVAGCGGSDSGTASKPKPKAQEIKGPKIAVAVMKPKADQKLPKGPVTAKVKLTKFKIDKKNVGKTAAPGRGHIHFQMDKGKFDKPKFSGPNGKLAEKLGADGKYSPAVAPKITYKGLPAGEHTLKVELANNDHSDTGVSQEVKFTVKKK